MANLAAEAWPIVVALALLSIPLVTTTHIVLNKRDTRAAIGWVGLVWLAPLIGSVAYLCFGVNRIRRKASSLQLRENWLGRSATAPALEDIEARQDYLRATPNLAGLAYLGETLTGNALVAGNSVEPLRNGDQSYPAMLAAIDQAQHSVNLQSYIFDNDQIGERFRSALLAARQRGVAVRVMIDDIGARYSRPTMLGRLRQDGLAAEAFLPTRAAQFAQYTNLRNHRKLLIVDGKIGFTGGTNIRDGHMLEQRPKRPVQCVHFRIEGPVVAHLQEAFAVDWAFVTGESLQGDAWFPPLERRGRVWARGLPDGPDEDFEVLTHTLIGALAAAQQRVRIVTPYFLPQQSVIAALNVADMRGVDVQIILPERSNIFLIQWASMAELSLVLEKGVRVFLAAPPFDHSKLMVVDDTWCLIGSTNWDARSLRLNFEFNLECYDRELAARINSIIDDKQRASREIHMSDITGRSLPVKLRDGLARLLTPYL